MKRLVLMTLIVVALVLPGAGADAAQRGGNCRTWAADETVLNMLHAGCMVRPSGVYQAAPGRCAKIARQAYRKGLRAQEDVRAYTAHRGCMFDGDSWENVSFTV